MQFLHPTHLWETNKPRYNQYLVNPRKNDMNKIMRLTMIAIAVSVSVFMLSTSLLSNDTPTETRDASKMLYLVTTDHFLQGTPRSPEQTELLFEQVIGSLKILNELQVKGKILAGGTPSGQRKHVFFIEANSNDEVTELLQSLPFWAEHRWEVVPLETWSHHLDYLTKLREQLGL